jgi:hypothetical protein
MNAAAPGSGDALLRAACDRHVGLACLYLIGVNAPDKVKLTEELRVCWFDAAACQSLFDPKYDLQMHPTQPDLSVLPRRELIAALHAGCETQAFHELKNRPCDLAQQAHETPGEWQQPAACSEGDEETCLARCASTGDPKTCLETGMAYLYGIHEPVAFFRAETLLQTACQAKYVEGGSFDDRMTIAPPDATRARACVVYGIATLGSAIGAGTFTGAMAPWEIACKAGDAAGCAHFASFAIDEMDFYGEQTQAKGMKTLDGLCNAGGSGADGAVAAWACAEASRGARAGLGMARDEGRAKSYRERACSLGLRRACGG